MKKDNIQTKRKQRKQFWLKGKGKYIKSVLIGILIFSAGSYFLLGIEKRKDEEKELAKKILETVKCISVSDVNSANEGKLIYATGAVATDEVLSDPEFDISANAIRLRRVVERYSTIRVTRTTGGSHGTHTRSHNEKKWVDPSSGKKIVDKMPISAYRSKDFNAKAVTLGGFVLPNDIVSKINEFEELRVKDVHGKVSEGIENKVTIYDGYYYVGKNHESPEIGDVRVKFQFVKPLNVSLIARQDGNSFGPYRIGTEQVELIQAGSRNVKDMLKLAREQSDEKMKLRTYLSFSAIFVGLIFIFKPFIPKLGIWKHKKETSNIVKVIAGAEGEHYITGMFAASMVSTILLMVGILFSGLGIYVLCRITGSIIVNEVKSDELFSAVAGAAATIIISLLFTVAGILLLYYYVIVVCRKETWIENNVLYHRRNFLGFTWLKEIPLEKIDSFFENWAGASLKKRYYCVKVKHCVGGSLMLSSKGFWDLEIASGFKKMGEAREFAKHLNERLGLLQISKPGKSDAIARTLQRRDKVLKRFYIIFGMWALLETIFCVAIGYLPIHPDSDNPAALVMMLIFIPLGFTISRMTSINFNAGRSSSKEEKKRYTNRFFEVLRKFPLSGICLIGVFVNAFVRSIFMRTSSNEKFFSVLAIFCALVAFMNLRLFLGGWELIDKWGREDKGR